MKFKRTVAGCCIGCSILGFLNHHSAEDPHAHEREPSLAVENGATKFLEEARPIEKQNAPPPRPAMAQQASFPFWSLG
jgi:hypothetical protein